MTPGAFPTPVSLSGPKVSTPPVPSPDSSSPSLDSLILAETSSPSTPALVTADLPSVVPFPSPRLDLPSHSFPSPSTPTPTPRTRRLATYSDPPRPSTALLDRLAHTYTNPPPIVTVMSRAHDFVFDSNTLQATSHTQPLSEAGAYFAKTLRLSVDRLIGPLAPLDVDDILSDLLDEPTLATSPSQIPDGSGDLWNILTRRVEDSDPKTRRLDAAHRGLVDASTSEDTYEPPQAAATHQARDQAKIRRRYRRIKNRR
ncbi:hypothetical protein RhiJN_25222 [Ceratobasidium sp. AG-Ba]|nr:hypothetical protein RhiJN_25222 [Ceratobasidium sp. AG-Ba]